MTQRYDDQMRITELDSPARHRRGDPRPRRRLWKIAAPLIFMLVLAIVWSGFWFYAASQATSRISEWQQREAQGGRAFVCANQDVGGFPFRLEVSCSEPTFELRNLTPELVLSGKFATVLAQVYDPTLLIGEFTGPIMVSETTAPTNASSLPGFKPLMSANWSLAQASLRGLPNAPERLSLVFDNPQVARMARAAMEPVAAAKRLELHSRVLSNEPENTAVEIVLRLAAGAAPAFHPAIAQPTDADIGITISGLRDLSPKPLVTYLRDLATTKGKIEIRNARIAQADVIATGTGTLGVTPDGLLDGQVTLTVVGLDKLIKILGLEEVMNQQLAQRGGMDKIVSGLDRILPGLGGAVRGNSGTIAAAGIAMLGAPAEVEGKKAIAMPLKFSAGMVSLGPLQIGQMAPLF
ncbi:MAG TPA: DUF2125 domain-containing protein [Xanthobacteraceae bacterium]|nr:DUF2125 domain-containing protein [Xanthobacteraceae bacterium]